MRKLLLLFGLRETTASNRVVLVRKRLLHKGYQISFIVWDKFYQESVYTLMEEYNTLEEVNDWLRRN